MNPTGITIIASVILGLGLTGTGTYLLIDNLVQPQGYLFESIMLLSLGIITLLLVAIAASIGKTIITFGEILKIQQQQQQDLRNQTLTNSGIQGPSFGTLLSSMLQNPGANKISIDMGSEDGSFGGIFPKQFEGLEGMGLEDLEKELAKAIKTDNYERADKINKAIKELKNLGGEPGEDNND
jgi:hypothetical protein